MRLRFTVDSYRFRNWFDHDSAYDETVPKMPRFARVGIWCNASRNQQDANVDHSYLDRNMASDDTANWQYKTEKGKAVSSRFCDWWDASNALIQLNYPFKFVSEVGDPTTELQGLSFLWLPSIAAITDESVEPIKKFVVAGGIVLATGWVSKPLDTPEEVRFISPLSPLFGVENVAEALPRVNKLGKGLAILRTDLQPNDLYDQDKNAERSLDLLMAIKHMLHIYLKEGVDDNGTKILPVEVQVPKTCYEEIISMELAKIF